MDSQLTCPLCNQEYREDKLPRLLTMCGHSYCEECIAALRTPVEGGFRVQCPEDQTEIDLLTTSLSCFPPNIALIKLIESKKNNSSSFKDESFDVSKITKRQELQQDEEADDLITAINEGKEQSSNHSKKSFDDQIPKESLKIEQTTETGIGIGSKDIVDHPREQNIVPTQITEKELQKEQKVLSKVQDTQNQGDQLCLLHQKPLQVVCTLDLVRICSKCAIFGKHKGHDFKGIDEIQSQNKDNYQKLLQVFEQKHQIEDRLKSQVTERQLLGILTQRGGKVRREITDKFKKAIEQITKAEKNALKKLEEVIGSVENKIKKLLRSQGSRNGYEKWEQESLKCIEVSEDNNFQGKMKFFMDGEGLVTRGQQFLKLLIKNEQNVFSQVDRFVSDFGITSNESVLEGLSGFIEVSENLKDHEEQKIKLSNLKDKENEGIYANQDSISHDKQQKRKTKFEEQIHYNDQSLLDLDDEPEQKIEKPIVTPRATEENLMKIQLPMNIQQGQSIVTTRKEQPVREKYLLVGPKKRQRTTINLGISKQDINKQLNQSLAIEKQQRHGRRKTKVIKVPQKYEKIMEGVLADNLDTVDFTNAQLGDSVATLICEYLRGSKARTVKFIRNKLTDDGVAKMIVGLGSVVTLNLSQNLLTENVLNILADQRGALPLLKSVILSQNKIIQRKHKTLLDKLRKLDLTVSV